MFNNLSFYLSSLRGRRLGLAAAFLILLPIPLRAGDQPDAKSTASPPVEKKKEAKEKSLLTFWDGRLVIDIEERIRGEIRENNRDFDSSINDDNDDSWLLNRFRIGL